MDRAEVAVVGAGPAGLAAALALAGRGVDVVLLDEQPRAGGQIYRQAPETFVASSPPRGRAYRRGRELLAAAAGSELRHLRGALAWGLFELGEEAPPDGVTPSPRWLVALAGGDRLERLAVRHVVLATGAYELPLAFPGWTLPGVMAAGGVQSFVKSQHLLPGRRFVLAGAHPFVLLVAGQLLAAGADIAAVALAQPRPTAGGAILAAARLGGRATRVREIAAPFARLRRAGVPVLFSHLVSLAEGRDEVEAVSLRSVDRSWLPNRDSDVRIECDTLALGYGFVPSTELARQAGCAHAWRSAAGGWVIEHDDWQRTSRKGISVAGEVTGIAGAEQAEDEGRLAAIGVLHDLGRVDAAGARRLAAPARRRLRRQRRFSRLVQERFEPRRPGLAALAADDTVICRCEEVTAGQVRQAFASQPHLGDLDAVKQLTRVGMGPCQGRFCQPTVAIVAAEATGRSLAELGTFTARPPVKPVRLGQFAAASR